MNKTSLNTLYHSVYSLHYHLVLVTKYRKRVLTPDILQFVKASASKVCDAWGCTLKEFNGESDHVHMLIDAPPNLKLSDFINNLKTVTSRLTRKHYAEHVKKFYWKPVFWHRSYCIASAGGAPLDIIRQYIESQSFGD